jgi:hypothetical protein
MIKNAAKAINLISNITYSAIVITILTIINIPVIRLLVGMLNNGNYIVFGIILSILTFIDVGSVITMIKIMMNKGCKDC